MKCFGNVTILVSSSFVSFNLNPPILDTCKERFISILSSSKYKTSLAIPATSPLLQEDKIHLNVSGNQRMCESVYRAITGKLKTL
jgi:lysophospholipase L1-like esterase